MFTKSGAALSTPGWLCALRLQACGRCAIKSALPSHRSPNMSRFESLNFSRLTRLTLGAGLMALGASLTACAHAVVQYSYGIPSAPLWVQPPVMMPPPQVVVQAPMYPYPIYSQPRWYSPGGWGGWHHQHHGHERGRGW